MLYRRALRWPITAPASRPGDRNHQQPQLIGRGLHPGQPAAPLPLDLAIVAMARSQLHQTAEAQSALEELRKLLKTDRWANDREARGFLKEAEEIVGGQKTKH